ncbi:SDR family NAD(P)-dependent oxidoreductase [Agromyces mangrovi Wang et al. 2018]|uniref:SDR family NAD(P)-dependent oxidoreductase n=1 Tax=Agromyces mangrovi TaxID=1858653 RepID=UPI00257368AA|nr:glucose 1-dehydrogenase [Agromyces mangrovi]BDZ63810.1 beta-ketoacyl-ACP reductase [Agromyces mangrovi]
MTAARRLEGRRAIVTGAARGIGRAIAERFAAEGASVAVLDLDADAAEATAAEIGARAFGVDLADHDAARAAVHEASAALGGLDVLVNNAGILRLGPLLEITPDEWDLVQRVNARSMLSTTQAAAAVMVPAGAGRIVNLASMAAKSGGANEAAYAASKAAVVALTRATALELGPHGITANALCPGYILTDMGAATRTDDDVARWSARSPLGRLGDPADVAGAALFLASDDGAYLTGQAINVTGGMIMH